MSVWNIFANIWKEYFVTEHIKLLKYKELKYVLRFVKLNFVAPKISFEKCSGNITNVYLFYNKHLKFHFQNYSEHTCLSSNTRSVNAAHKRVSVCSENHVNYTHSQWKKYDGLMLNQVVSIIPTVLQIFSLQQSIQTRNSYYV